MKSFTFAAILASAAVAYAQVTFDPSTNTFSCPISNGAYCAGTSLQSNIIIRCSNGTGHAGNCNDNLAGVPPVGVKTFAPCWQTSDKSGDAACSFNGIAYPDNGASFPINGTSSTATTSAAGQLTVSAAGAASTPCNSTTGAAGAAGATGATGYAAPTGTWKASGSPTPTAFHGAAEKVMGSASLALLPVAGFIAYMF